MIAFIPMVIKIHCNMAKHNLADDMGAENNLQLYF